MYMECLRCGNKDPTYFHYGSKGYYCRKCISFSRALIEEDIDPVKYDIGVDAYDYEFKYELTTAQKQASRKCLEKIRECDVLLNCVCGAGKTEIVVESISDYLKRGLKVAYAISRREVVIELEKRFKDIFPKADVIGVYGGHHKQLTGDLIICTCHQLFRYYHSFDLLIIDEVDAFPLKGNVTLMNIAFHSCVGHIIYSTATKDDELMRIVSNRKYYEIDLYTRPSNKPLIVPKIIYLNKLLTYFFLAYLMYTSTNQCIIFVNSKKECELYYKIFSHLFACSYVYSDLDKRKENIMDFKNKKYKYIFATSVLERGITIKDVDVCILNFNMGFDKASLIQMLGRVGRNINNPYGNAYIVTDHIDRNIFDTIKYLNEANAYL